MSFDQLTLEYWDGLDSATRTQIARLMGETLPPPFRFAGLETHALGDQRHEIAYFDWQGAKFALIPGGQVTLGYDREHPFVPTKAQLESWYGEEPEAGNIAAATMPSGEVIIVYSGKATDEWEVPPLEEHLTNCLTPLRTISIKPFLIEVAATELGTTPLDTYGSFAVRPVTHRQAGEAAASAGFRLPTSDEWEHACAAGSRTLFRWGNDCPTDCCPSGDRWADESPWDLHRRPNAFGLQIASNPYKWEFCAEPGIMRGGDGGCAICGGDGFFAGWLTLASAYVDRSQQEQNKLATAHAIAQLVSAAAGESGVDPKDVAAIAEKGTYGTHLRRAYPLP